ncbi:ABC transporter substrate-binding protein [Candidatus Woesebacteria bacterium]|nr:ABC transporter substrate-binding protein [Candidatus Woesebacteria bacterium]
MLTLRYLVRLIGAFIFRFKALILFGVASGALLFFMLNFLKPLIVGRSMEKIGITGRFRTDNLPNSILSMVSSGLTKIDENGEAKPDLASSWETKDSGKTWIFRLKEGLVWQDGKKIVSKDINYDFSDVRVEKPDDKTLVFKLQTPFSPLTSIVSRPIFKKGFLGTGKWKVIRISLTGSFLQELVLENGEKDRKIYKFYPTEEQSKLAFKLGEVDKLLNIFNPTPFESWKTVSVSKEIDTDKLVAIFFDTKDKLLSEKSLRQALAYAIKKDDLGSERALGPISPSSWAYNPQVKPYNFDPKRAEELTEELPKEIRENLNINLATTPVLLATQEKVVKDWESVGVKTTVRVSPGIPSGFQALLAIFDIPEDPDQYSVWHSTQVASNISHYSNPRIDKLLEDGRAALSLEERRKIYLDFQRFLVEDSPAVFLYHPISYTIKRR